MTILLRRRKLGNTSCREISAKSHQAITVHRHDRRLNWQGIDKVIRWGCTATIPQHVEVINNAEAIAEVNDKLTFRLKLAAQQLAPATITTLAEAPAANYPLIVRPSRHHQGLQYMGHG